MTEQTVRHPKKNILAIDDDGLVRKSLAIFLKEAGYEPTTANGGMDALSYLPQKHFDLIITDIRMPGMDGLQVIQAVRDYYDQIKKPHVPIVVLTAYNDEPVKQSAIRMGIKDFVIKPFKLEDFLKVLERNFGKG